MSIHLYNSLTKKKEEFVPLTGRQVNMYVCGVTVYDQCHIGHARSLYVFDVIRRYFQYRGYQVRFVRNITDIDDKIINRAKELNEPWETVVQRNIDLYRNDLESLGIPQADEEPRATENIPEMIEHIGALIPKGFAYEVDGSVYYSVRAFQKYGRLSGQSIEKMLEGVRIEPDEQKKDPLDFALWKKSNVDEPGWESPWGRGRPGWHIECSCMSMKYLKTPMLDIHAGGRDLIFPHHENEIAQSEVLTEKPFAKYWLHHGLLTIQGHKMAKSSGNFITIQEALRKYSADELKFFFLSSHYASPIDFTEEKMREAHKAMQRLEIFFKKAIELRIRERQKVENIDFIEKNKENFLKAMDDDFNTPKALGCLFDFVRDANKYMDSSKDDDFSRSVIDEAATTINRFLIKIFGILLPRDQGLDLAEGQKITTLLEERKKERSNKNFKKADEIRIQLKALGVIVEDTPQGQKHRRA